ncbi:erythromycin esterase family protein [Streptomyces diastatochromogenes]|uniref:erythromycin esterase family protein n=1 Tax=Streptomyces diastatochromogenes TaxID=42236 RepID=UPI0036B51D34
MRKNPHDLTVPSCDLLALGEPTHQEPAFGWVRNELFVQLVERGFRSIALETDRVAALDVNEFVQGGAGSLDTVLREGFSHDFGDLEPNRQLIAWMREHNRNRPAEERLAFHGFDTPTENHSAPSPRRYLEYTRDYLQLGVDLAELLGDDEGWSRTEAVMDPAMSLGGTVEAEQVRSIADAMLALLHTRAPEPAAVDSHAEWLRARTHLMAGLGLLRYHKQCAQSLEHAARISRLLATRDSLIAQSLLDVRSVEARRGPTLAFGHNLHFQRDLSTWCQADLDLNWHGAGTVLGPLMGEQYAFVAGSLGRSEALGLLDPEPDTYEGLLQSGTSAWELTADVLDAPARTRTDITPRQGYRPLDRTILEGADAVLHISDGTAAALQSQDALLPALAVTS